MKKMALLLILVLAGCATATDPWIGASADKLKTTWGEPLKMEDDGTGGQILTYELGFFYVDSSGIIYQTETNYNRPPAVDKWVGKNVKELIAEKGSPSKTFNDGNGGQILRYTYSKTLTTPGGWSHSSGPTGYYRDGRYIYTPPISKYTPPRSSKITSIKNFYVNTSGIIYKTDNGNSKQP